MDWNKTTQKPEKDNPIEELLQNFVGQGGNLFKVLLAGVVIVGFATSVYTVQPEEQAVVLRLGAYHDTTGPGLNFKVPYGIDQVTKLKTSAVLQESFGFISDSTGAEISGGETVGRSIPRDLKEEKQMLTGDLNVADVEWVVHYRISDPKQYLFNVREPRKNIRDISQATMRRVVGDRTVNDVLTVGREEIASEGLRMTQEILNRYEMGVEIVLVKLQDVNPPRPVQPSFNDVNAAKQEQEQAINQAEEEYNRVIPEARGRAEEQISSARGYALAVVNRAKGDVEKFSQVLEEYRKAPEVTRTRFYLETVEELLTRVKGLTIVDPNLKGVIPLYGQQSQMGQLAVLPIPGLEETESSRQTYTEHTR